MAAIPRLKPYGGPALFSYGFRPFFLGGAFYAGLVMVLWLPLYFGHFSLPTAFAPLDWHMHEMLYGFLPAVITGFLLTAIPNWTGRMPLQGGPLIVLVAAWLAGRIAIGISAWIGPGWAAAIDLLFLVLIAAAAAREVIAGRNWRNLPPVGLLILFLIGNAVFHAEAASGGPARLGERIAVAAAIALIGLIGGRVIPSFTRNWLARENPGRMPVPFGTFDRAVLGASVAALLAWVALPGWTGTAILLALAGLLQAARLARWAGHRTVRDRLVLVLHIGYAFVPAGFLLVAASIPWPDRVPLSAGVHAWTAGAIGVMTLAIMTRASLGHTGHRLAAGPLTQIIYAAVVIAALARICAALEPDFTLPLLHLAAGGWILAFWAFALGYGPLLARPRMKAA